MDNNQLYRKVNEQIVIEIQSIDKEKDYDRYNELATQLIRANERLIYKCASKYKNLAPADEVEQAIRILLVRCAESYDVNMGVAAFSSYFYRSVAVSLERTISNDHYHNFKTRQKSEFKSVYEKLSKQGNYNPTQEEIQKELNEKTPYLAQTAKMIYNIYNPISLNTPIEGEEDLTIGDTIASDESLIDNFDKKEQSYKLHLAVNALPKRDADIITKLYLEERRQTEVAKEYGITQSYICRIAESKLKTLKLLMKNYMDELVLADNLREQYAEAKQAHKRYNTDKVVSKNNITNANVVKLIALYNHKTEYKNRLRWYATEYNNNLCDPADAAKVIDICVLNRPMAEICAKYQISPTSIRREINDIQKRAQEPVTEKIADRN